MRNKKITFSISLTDYELYKSLNFTHRKRVLSKFRLYGSQIIQLERRYQDYEKGQD